MLEGCKGLLESASYSTKAVSELEKFQAMKDTIKPGNSSTGSKEVLVGETEDVPVQECEVKEEEVESRDTETIHIKTEEPEKKRRKVDTNANNNGRKEWLCIGGIKLRMEDRYSIIAGERLNDMIINVAQRLL